MKLTRVLLRRMINEELTATKHSGFKRNSLRFLLEDEEKSEDKKADSKFKPLKSGTNIKDVDPTDVYNQLASRNGDAPIFGAMSGAKWTIDPEKCADWVEKIGEEEFVSRLTTLQGKIPSSGLPKDQMPVLPNPADKGIKGKISDFEDILTPGGEYNVDFESKVIKGKPMTEAVMLFNRWGKLAGLITEKVEPPAANALAGGDEESKAYLTSGLNDDNDEDDNIPFEVNSSLKASAAIPTQSNILIGKTIGMAIPKDAGGGGMTGGPIDAYAGTDGEILDGHHRWAAMMISNPDADMGTVMSIDLAAVGSGDKKAGLKQLTAIGNAMGNKTKTEGRYRKYR